MTVWRMIGCSLWHHRGTNLGVVLGLAVATAVITGSLLVGDSMRASQERQAVARLGNVDEVLLAPHFFRADLADELGRVQDTVINLHSIHAVPYSKQPYADFHFSSAILLKGSARLPQNDAVSVNVNICGVETSFQTFFPQTPLPKLTSLQAAINQSLADDLGLNVGDDLLVYAPRAGLIPGPSLFARRKRQDALRTLRLQVSAILPNRGAGVFSLDSSPAVPRLVYVNRETLANMLQKPEQANAILVSAPPEKKDWGMGLDNYSNEVCRLSDYGLRLTVSKPGQYVSLESDRIFFTRQERQAAEEAARLCDLTIDATSVYLATKITATNGQKSGTSETPGLESRTGRMPVLPKPREISYALFAAMDTIPPFHLLAGTTADPGDDEIVLNSWAAQDLGAAVGDELTVTYLVPGPDGGLGEERIRRKLCGIVDLSGPAADPHLTPALGGLTDAERVDNWDVPFPIDKSRITERDDQYWNRYHATPKAFVSPNTMRAVWASADSSLPDGNREPITSLRFLAPSGVPPGELVELIRTRLREELKPSDCGLGFEPVRKLAQERSVGNSDLGGLLLGMGFFLIAAAGGLAGTFLRLIITRRAKELGLLLACGWKKSAASRILFYEASVLAVLGALLGLPLGVLYCLAMIQWLGQSVAAAWGQVDLQLHLTPLALWYGATGGLLVGLLCAAWGLMALRRRTVLELLSGWQALAIQPVYSRWPKAICGTLLLLSAGTLACAAGGWVSSPTAFFAGGAGLLLACLVGVYGLLTGSVPRPCRKRIMAEPGEGEPPSETSEKPGGTGFPACALSEKTKFFPLLTDFPEVSSVRLSLPLLAMRSAALNRSRSLLIVGLFACAAFILVAVGANFRSAAEVNLRTPSSSAGGFDLLVTTTIPLPSDPATPAGRANLGFSRQDEPILARATILPLLVGPGDDVSCLSTTRPLVPRLLGVNEAMIKRGGFNVQLAQPTTASNPWTALLRDEPGGAIPVFGDADSVRWTLHGDLGQVLNVSCSKSRCLPVQIAGLFPGSIFAGELVTAEKNFRRLYPDISGPKRLLVQSPPGEEQEMERILRNNLADFGVEVRTTRDLLSSYLAVQNLYLSLFMLLGGLGLLLGAAGLPAVMLQSVLERRGELALLSACGFRKNSLVRWLLLEYAGLLWVGLWCGTTAALLAVGPTLVARNADVPWAALAAMLVGIGAVGVLVAAVTARQTIGSGLLAALRQE